MENGFLSALLEPDAGYTLTSWLFLRFLGLVYFVAFASFGLQVSGLIGEQGILPAAEFLAAVKKALGRKGYLAYPTLAWINARDAAFKLLCGGGVVLSLLLLFGLQVTPVLVLLWLFYLSLVTIGQIFLAYQWDALLLEAGFLAIFLVPPSLLPRQAMGSPSTIVIFLFHWLLFRLMFMSGMLKWASGDPTWRGLTALAFHYETQPLPTPLAWYLHRAPLWFQKASTLFTLFVEIVLPFLFFAPGALRIFAGLMTILLQVLIMLTGSFAFFNILTIALTVFLFRNAVIERLLPGWLNDLLSPFLAPSPAATWGSAVLLPLAAILVLGGLQVILARLLPRSGTFKAVQARVAPILQILTTFRIVNSYGLFVAMTTVRPEIIIEGSDDGVTWLPYEFKYKPGDLRRRPPVVAPHQPRLDWQMWFAALRNYPQNPWFLRFVERLLEGSPPVLRLLEKNPFPDRPPKYLRAIRYDYQFSRPEERTRTGNWWRRSALGPYLPVVNLEDR